MWYICELALCLVMGWNHFLYSCWSFGYKRVQVAIWGSMQGKDVGCKCYQCLHTWPQSDLHPLSWIFAGVYQIKHQGSIQHCKEMDKMNSDIPSLYKLCPIAIPVPWGAYSNLKVGMARTNNWCKFVKNCFATILLARKLAVLVIQNVLVVERRGKKGQIWICSLQCLKGRDIQWHPIQKWASQELHSC